MPWAIAVALWWLLPAGAPEAWTLKRQSAMQANDRRGILGVLSVWSLSNGSLELHAYKKPLLRPGGCLEPLLWPCGGFCPGRARGMDAGTTERYAGNRGFKRLKPVKRQPWTPIRSHCCGRGDALSHCCGLVVAFACGRAQGMDALTTERYAGKRPAGAF